MSNCSRRRMHAEPIPQAQSWPQVEPPRLARRVPQSPSQGRNRPGPDESTGPARARAGRQPVAGGHSLFGSSPAPPAKYQADYEPLRGPNSGAAPAQTQQSPGQTAPIFDGPRRETASPRSKSHGRPSSAAPKRELFQDPRLPEHRPALRVQAVLPAD
jgi:hypothetical protein